MCLMTWRVLSMSPYPQPHHRLETLRPQHVPPQVVVQLRKVQLLGTDGYCSPRQRMLFYSRNEDSNAFDHVASTIHGWCSPGHRMPCNSKNEDSG